MSMTTANTTLTYGLGNSITNPSLVGKTIQQLRVSEQAQVMGIPSDANYFVGGRSVTDSYVIAAGDSISAEGRAASKA